MILAIRHLRSSSFFQFFQSFFFFNVQLTSRRSDPANIQTLRLQFLQVIPALGFFFVTSSLSLWNASRYSCCALLRTISKLASLPSSSHESFCLPLFFFIFSFPTCSFFNVAITFCYHIRCLIGRFCNLD